jgi:NhaA family Na+:H+ antiporter
MLKFLKHTFLHPLKEFINDSRAIGVCLLCCTFISLIIANTSLGISYTNFWQHSFQSNGTNHFHILFLSFPNSILTVINDFLMAIFFFMAGMEIKREILVGELSSIQKSLLPLAAAMGGMLFPALLFTICNKGTNYQNGWAIPTATDIAFTLGIASLLGKRAPVNLKIFLMALAIIDDLGAIIVIAFFYGEPVHYLYIIGVLLGMFLLWLLNYKKVKFGIGHLILGILLWYCMFNSGIHATVAGVVFAMFIPVKLLHRFEIKIHTFVYFLILPLFALANTAIVFPNEINDTLTGSLSWGIIFGLCLGKPIGIFLTSYFFVYKKWALLPLGISLKSLLGGGMLAGIGFTMSIFISTLAFDDIALQNAAKISTLLASFIAIILGCIIFVIPEKQQIK